MITEALAARATKHSFSPSVRLAAHLPRYAPVASRFPFLANLRNAAPLLAKVLEKPTGFTSTRDPPKWGAKPVHILGSNRFRVP